MATHRFTVNVPNPTGHRVAVQLSLKRMNDTGLKKLALDIAGTDLKILSAGLTQDPCGDEGDQSLRLKLEPYSSVDVQVVVVSSPSGSKKGNAAAFHLIDERGGKIAGGVLLVCADPPLQEPIGQVIATARGCPVVLASDAYPVLRNTDPSKPPANKSIPLGTEVEFVVPITNPTKARLCDVQVYLEHLGTCDAEFVPATWNVGTLSSGDEFFATWIIRTPGWMVGTFEASIVVVSRRTNPVRLGPVIRITRAAQPKTLR